MSQQGQLDIYCWRFFYRKMSIFVIKPGPVRQVAGEEAHYFGTAANIGVLAHIEQVRCVSKLGFPTVKGESDSSK